MIHNPNISNINTPNENLTEETKGRSQKKY